MSVVNVKKQELNKIGYANFKEWQNDTNNMYIGRNMSYYVEGTNKSKWHNPYSAKKYGREECLVMFENYIKNSPLINALEELRGKNLGCWCKPEKCHGDILLNLLNSK